MFAYRVYFAMQMLNINKCIMHIITPSYCNTIASQLKEFKSMTSTCKVILFSMLRAFCLIRKKCYDAAEDCLAVGIENIVKHYGLK